MNIKYSPGGKCLAILHNECNKWFIITQVNYMTLSTEHAQ